MILIRIIFFLLAGAASALALSEQQVGENFDVTPGARLVVDVDFGTIDVTRGTANKIDISAYRKIDAGNEAQEKEYFAAAPIVITKDANTVTVTARRAKGTKSWNWGEHTTMQARYTIHVPEQVNVEIATGGGEISAAEVSGSFKAQTSGGNLKFSRLHGPLRAETSGGAISLEACDGTLDVETSGGKIDTLAGGGNLRASTSGGSVAVRNFNGDAKVETSGGSLNLENIRGRLVAETSGGSISATIPAPLPGDIKLETSAGRIEVAVPPDAGLDVNAETGVGNVTSELPVIAKRSGHDGLQGTINGGGKALVLRSGAGNILIKSTSIAR